MKQLTKRFTPFLIILALMLPWATAEALETFERAGTISSIGYDEFTLNRKKYRIAPGAKLSSRDPARQKFSDFKKGDQIYFKGKVLGSVNYVDIIFFIVPDES